MGKRRNYRIEQSGERIAQSGTPLHTDRNPMYRLRSRECRRPRDDPEETALPGNLGIPDISEIRFSFASTKRGLFQPGPDCFTALVVRSHALCCLVCAVQQEAQELAGAALKRKILGSQPGSCTQALTQGFVRKNGAQSAGESSRVARRDE